MRLAIRKQHSNNLSDPGYAKAALEQHKDRNGAQKFQAASFDAGFTRDVWRLYSSRCRTPLQLGETGS